MRLEHVIRALSASWSADTTQLEDWSPANPARGQCCVSSLVVEHYFGGKLARGHTNLGTVHYWNILDHCWLDVTRSQFGPEEYIVDYELDPARHLWWFRDTELKYQRLKARVEKWILYNTPENIPNV
jgi:hypothetical protein